MTDSHKTPLQESFDKHAAEDAIFQREQVKTNAKTEKSLASIHKRLGATTTREDTAEIVEEVIRRMLLSKGKTAYTIIIGAGALAVALAGILGGFKTILAAIGLSIIHR